MVIPLDIYIDVLLLLNSYVNYFLLRGAAKLMHRALKSTRCILAAVIGSFFSLSILLPEMNLAVLLLFKLCSAWVMVRIAFGRLTRLREPLCFLLVSCGFGGGMLALILLLNPAGMAMHNGSLYIEFSPLMLVVCTILAYAVTCLIRRILDKNGRSTGRYKVLIRANRHVISLEGLSDTGNSLVDSFSGRSVIVCGKNQLTKLTGCDGAESSDALFTGMTKSLHGVRLIPYSTVSSGGVMPIFRPDEVIILEESTRQRKQVDALIGVGEADTKAIFNPKLLL